MSRCPCDCCTARNRDAGALLIAAIHAAEDDNRGRPGYRSGVRSNGPDRLRTGNRIIEPWRLPPRTIRTIQHRRAS